MLESNVKIGVTEISPRAVQQAAELNFKNGYYCCEALMATIKQEFKLDVPDSVIAMASGMAVGAGKSGMRLWCIQRRYPCTWYVLRSHRAERSNQSKECKMYGTDA